MYLIDILDGVVAADEEDPGDLVDARVAVDAHRRDQRVLPLRSRGGGGGIGRGGGGRPRGREVEVILQIKEKTINLSVQLWSCMVFYRVGEDTSDT